MKYGLKNFEFKVLIDPKNKEEMNLLEKMVVTEEFCKRKDTYNINIGGEGSWSAINNNSEYAEIKTQAVLKGAKAAYEKTL